MTSSVTITTADGEANSYPCFGATDAAILTYAATVVAVKADRDDLGAAVAVTTDGRMIEAPATVGDLLRKDL